MLKQAEPQSSTFPPICLWPVCLAMELLPKYIHASSMNRHKLSQLGLLLNSAMVSYEAEHLIWAIHSKLIYYIKNLTS